MNITKELFVIPDRNFILYAPLKDVVMRVNSEIIRMLKDVTSVDDENIICHDSGPIGAMPNKRIPRELFEQALDLCFFDMGIVSVPIKQG